MKRPMQGVVKRDPLVGSWRGEPPERGRGARRFRIERRQALLQNGGHHAALPFLGWRAALLGWRAARAEPAAQAESGAKERRAGRSPALGVD